VYRVSVRVLVFNSTKLYKQEEKWVSRDLFLVISQWEQIKLIHQHSHTLCDKVCQWLVTGQWFSSYYAALVLCEQSHCIHWINVCYKRSCTWSICRAIVRNCYIVSSDVIEDTIIKLIHQHSHTLCDKVCQWLVTGQWFSPGTQVSSTN
jgi:hypothetical protein